MADIVSIIAEVNGQTYDLTKPSSGTTWTKQFSAPADTSGSNNGGNGPGVGGNATGGYYPVKVTVTDAYGNITTVTTSTASLGESLKLKVLETVAPIAAISYPSSGATINNAKPVIQFTITDSGSGVNPSAVYIKIDGGTATKVTPNISGSVATCEYEISTALDEGNHTIVVYGTDYDGNTSEEATTTFVVDTAPPILNISAPADNIKTNVTAVTVSGTTNDTTSKPVTVAIDVDGTDQGTVTVNADGSFSKEVTLVNGKSNVISIVATDASGLTTTVTRTIDVSTSAPEITSIVLTPNPSQTGASVTISVTIKG